MHNIMALGLSWCAWEFLVCGLDFSQFSVHIEIGCAVPDTLGSSKLPCNTNPSFESDSLQLAAMLVLGRLGTAYTMKRRA